MKSHSKNGPKKPSGAKAGRKHRPQAAGYDRLVVRKWGNSAGLRIPMAMMKAAKLKLNQEVDARVEDGELVVTPVRRKKYTLRELLDGITPENTHDPVETDGPVGNEIW